MLFKEAWNFTESNPNMKKNGHKILTSVQHWLICKLSTLQVKLNILLCTWNTTSGGVLQYLYGPPGGRGPQFRNICHRQKHFNLNRVPCFLCFCCSCLIQLSFNTSYMVFTFLNTKPEYLEIYLTSFSKFLQHKCTHQWCFVWFSLNQK